ncbi:MULTISPECIES: oligosaccharide flippase family protein [Clostridia]|uniref:lipopolysaccharide biosynthesis protein n=1 Tax=Clostridia TaxID=186801 RepID=UPI0005D42612|nr:MULTISPECIES: oligosaccharide flippase family protein [Clostridia]KJJ70743.1 polysaccharide biosynthesis protein [Clostridium sp. FS41]MCB7066597.1 oligosaccharide flippase family protein [Enterocloster citroniae]
MNNRNKELVVNTLILGIGQFIPKLMTLIILPILTMYLTTNEYGNYDLVLSLASFLIPILTLQIQQAVLRYLLSTLENDNKDKYVTSALYYVTASSVILLPIIFAILCVVRVRIAMSLSFCILFFSETMYTLLGQIVRGLGQNTKFSIGVIIYAFVNMLLTILFVTIWKQGLFGVVISLVLSYILTNLYYIYGSDMFKHIHRDAFSKYKLKELLDFSIPIVPSSIALWVVNLSDRLVIIYFLGASSNGIYAVANKIPALYNSAYNIFNLAWTETASKVSDDGNPADYYSRMFRILFHFLIGIMLAMITCTPFIFRLLVKGSYGGAFFQVPILYVGIFFNSFVSYYSGIYIAMKRTKEVGESSIAGALLNIIINIILIKEIGLYAASISTALSFAVIVLYRAYDLNKVINIKYNIKDITIGLLFFIVSSMMLYYQSIWSTVICLILAILYNLRYNLILIKKLFCMF